VPRSVDVVLAVARLAIGVWLLWRIPGLPGRRGATSGRPPVAVVVPARDEAASLPRLLASVRTQLRDGDEVVVVDDHSTDDTAEAAAACGARVVPAPDLPPGWSGKAWACHTGTGATTAGHLLFLDADVELEPGAIDDVIGAVTHRGGLVSVAPLHRVERPYEHLSAVPNAIAVMGTACATPLGDRVRTRGAFGPVLAAARTDHDRVGGHAHPAVRGAVLDDIALAGAYQDAGLPVTIAGGRGLASYRMYPHGLRQLVEGWVKNLAAAALAISPVTAIAVTAWTTVLVQAALAPLLAPWPWGPALYVAAAVQVWWMLRRLGTFHPLAAVAFPVLVAAFLVVIALSAHRTLLRHRVRWRGRDLPV
jgi:4,4'-diaponeurosporenoate glycosyltransferase